MNNPTYESIDENLDLPATKADVEKILSAIEILYQQLNNLSSR